MKKKPTITAAIVMIVVALACACAFTACGKTQESPAAEELSYWMKTIRDDTPITQMVIPGSHDSGTVGMVSVCETQNKDFAAQLAVGTRYFDVRPRLKGNGEIVFYHMFSSDNRYEDFLADVEEFLSANPSEFLILDHQHCDPAEESFYNIIFGMLEEKLGAERILCAPEGVSDADYINSLTLGDVRGKVLVTLGTEDLPEQYPFVMTRDADAQVREGSVLHSPYIGKYNKSGSEEYVSEYLQEYIDMYAQLGGICILQGQLTGGILEDKEAKHDPNMSAWIRALKDDEETLAHINVIMRDYVTGKKCADIIELNKYKGFVKDECVTEFDALVAKFAE